MIYNHEWRDAEVRRNFRVLTLSFQISRRRQRPPKLAPATPTPTRQGSNSASPAGSRGPYLVQEVTSGFSPSFSSHPFPLWIPLSSNHLADCRPISRQH